MGKLKKIGIIFFFITAFIGIIFLRYLAYYPVEKLKISGKASTTPQGGLYSIPVGNELAIFPEEWEIKVNISISNYGSNDLKLEAVNYIIYLEKEKIAEGSFQDVLLNNIFSTTLKINFLLDLNETTEKNPQLIETAVQNQGKKSLKISVKLTTPALFLGILRIGTAEKSEDIWADINLLDTLRVSSFNWKADYRTVNDCNPGDELVGEFEVWKKGVMGERVEAEIIEVVKDGSIRTLTRQTLGEGLKSGYNGISINWSIPESPPLDCIGYSVRLLFEGVEVWRTPIDPPSIRLIRSISLTEAFSEEGIIITLRGRGYCAGDTILIKIKAELEVSVDLEVEPGTILINSGSGQNMITAEAMTVRLEPKIEVEIKIEAYCLDLHKDNPNSSEVFRIAEDLGGYCPEAVDLMQSLKEVSWEHKSVSGIQLALWVVIEDPTRSEVQRVFGVSESALEDAAWLLDNIGIDPTQKRLFKES